MDYNIVRSELVCQEIKEGESEGESSENEIITVTNLDNGRKEILRIDQPNKRASVVVS